MSKPGRGVGVARWPGLMAMAFLLGCGVAWAGGGAVEMQGGAVGSQGGAIPNQEALRQRAIATAAQFAEQREKYECRERQVQNDVDGKGRVKKTTVMEQDFFFVGGRPVLREITRDGKPLDRTDRDKQDARVKKEIEEAEKAQRKDKKNEGTPLSSRNFLKIAKMGNERRVVVAGRPTIVFDVLDDPNARGGSIPEKIIAAMRGTISIDEETGHVQDLDVTGVRDVKIGGGVLANVHKGFKMHLIDAPQNDGVWMLKSLYGSGDARIGLFLHPAANFSTQVESCHLFNVTADATVKEVEGRK